MKIMNEKQLKNLPTPSLKNLRRLVLNALAAAKHNVSVHGNDGDIQRADTLTQYYNDVDIVLSTRIKLESTKQRPRSRETIRRLAA